MAGTSSPAPTEDKDALTSHISLAAYEEFFNSSVVATEDGGVFLKVTTVIGSCRMGAKLDSPLMVTLVSKSILTDLLTKTISCAVMSPSFLVNGHTK